MENNLMVGQCFATRDSRCQTRSYKKKGKVVVGLLAMMVPFSAQAQLSDCAEYADILVHEPINTIEQDYQAELQNIDAVRIATNVGCASLGPAAAAACIGASELSAADARKRAAERRDTRRAPFDAQREQFFLECLADPEGVLGLPGECNDGETGPGNDCNTPIVFDLKNDDFSFTDVRIDPVLFDIDGDGELELTAWTEEYGDDAFLVLDRNGNGEVDGGGELFGDATRLLSGELADNGYEALGELDTEDWGGNGDSVISRADDAYHRLRLWQDRNHDGLSEAHELKPLRAVGIVAIDLKYDRDVVVDRYGNTLVYFSRALRSRRGRETVILTTDVFFRTMRIGG